MIDPWKLTIFTALTALAVTVSIHAWRKKQTYGFFRFLGIESLVVLVVLNTGHWFRESLSVPQIISWTIFILSTALAAHGSYLLRSVGRARHRIIEGTQAVVENGVYRFIRHPLYAALAFFGWGVFFKNIDVINGSLATASTVFWLLTARCEERFNVLHFGDAYLEYMKRTKMFIPFLL